MPPRVIRAPRVPQTTSSDSEEEKIDSTSVQIAEMGARLEKRRLIFKIQNFSALRPSDKLIAAQKFQFEAGDSVGLPTTWEFYLQNEEARSSRQKRKWMGAYIKLVKKPEGVTDVFMSYDLSIKKANGDHLFQGNINCKNMSQDVLGWGFMKLLEQDADATGVVQKDGSLVIEVEFRLLSEVTPINVDLPGKVKAFEVKSLVKLSQDLGQLRLLKNAKVDSSTVIISKDGVKFPVNRGILSSRSTVFQRMFQQKWKEVVTGEFHIFDLSGKSVEVLLHYIYTGTLHQDWKSPDVIEELSSAAHRYDLALLTAFLDDILGSVATKENALRLAILARTLGIEKAEKELFAFVKNNAISLEDLTLQVTEDKNDLWTVVWNNRRHALFGVILTGSIICSLVRTRR